MNVRGHKLKEYLTLKLMDLIGIYQDRNELYVYSQKEFSRYAKVSRETVRKYQAEIDVVLQSLVVSKRTFDKDAQCRNLQAQVLKMQAELAKMEDMYTAIRDQYIGIVEALLSNSIDTSHLIVRFANTLKVEQMYKKCILCSSVLGDG